MNLAVTPDALGFVRGLTPPQLFWDALTAAALGVLLIVWCLGSGYRRVARWTGFLILWHVVMVPLPDAWPDLLQLSLGWVFTYALWTEGRRLLQDPAWRSVRILSLISGVLAVFFTPNLSTLLSDGGGLRGAVASVCWGVFLATRVRLWPYRRAQPYRGSTAVRVVEIPLSYSAHPADGTTPRSTTRE